MTDEHKPGWRSLVAVVLVGVLAILSAYFLHDSPENAEPVPTLPVDLNEILK